MIFFTSDLHLGHKNIIKYSKRPFKDVKDMDQTIIQNWNKVVSDKDTVYLLGDFSFYPTETTERILHSLKGNKHLVRGNHDKVLKGPILKNFKSVQDFLEIKVEDKEANETKRPEGFQRIVLCHYALRVWNKSHFGSWHLYGHSHGSLPDQGLSFDVGVDSHNYTPISYDQVKEIMKTKVFVPVDHHDRYRQ